MLAAEPHPQETARLEALARLDLLDTAQEEMLIMSSSLPQSS